jgi:hypothetical protein
MSDFTLIYPVGKSYPVTQSYDEHIQSAKAHGWCWKPGNCPGGVYYYGGIDWGCPTGTPIYAAAEGTISKVVRNAAVGYGWAVYMLHPNGFTTIYGHMGAGEIKVNVGDKLPVGALLGYSDNTGNSTGPHLHFELRDKTGLAVDPTPYLKGAPIVVPPPVEPPVLSGEMVKVKAGMHPRLRIFPVLDPGNILIDQLQPGEAFEFVSEIEAGGRKWTRVACYIASEFMEAVE